MEFLQVIALALIPAAGNFGGGVLAELLPVSRRTLSLALHLAAGIVIAVIAVEIMPRGLDVDPPWVMVLFFVFGGLFFVTVDWLIGIVQRRTGSGNNSSVWLI